MQLQELLMNETLYFFVKIDKVQYCDLTLNRFELRLNRLSIFERKTSAIVRRAHCILVADLERVRLCLSRV